MMVANSSLYFVNVLMGKFLQWNQPRITFGCALRKSLIQQIRECSCLCHALQWAFWYLFTTYVSYIEMGLWFIVLSILFVLWVLCNKNICSLVNSGYGETK